MCNWLERKPIPRPEITIDAEKRREALARIRQAANEYKPQYQPTRVGMFIGQLRYISNDTWMWQSLFLAAAILLSFLFRNQMKQAELCILYGSIVAAGVGIVAVMELSKSMSCHMAELEESCYFNLGQIWSIKLILLGGLDLCVLGLLILGMRGRGTYGLLALGLYLLVPFVISNFLYLLYLTLSRGKRKVSVNGGSAADSWPQIVMAVFMCILAAMPSAFPKVYCQSSLWIWGIILAAGVISLGIEIRLLLTHASAGGEKICWN